MGRAMIGKRRDLTEWSWTEDVAPHDYDYGKLPNGEWYGWTPVGMAGLNKHQIVEHEDGTITVSPSILVTVPHRNEQWHGFLEAGVWREA